MRKRSTPISNLIFDKNRMTKIMKSAMLLGLIFFIGTASSAQDRKFSNRLTIGPNFPMLDTGVGYHIGYNPDISIAKNLGVQGQVSYSFTDIKSTFISGNTGSYKSINLLVGPRLYLRDSIRKFRPYLCALAGIDRLVETRSGIKRDPAYLFGLSMGLYGEVKNFLFGFCAETPSIYVLKLGYKF